MSDQQLLQECRFLPWEKRLWRFAWSARGCLTVLALAGLLTWLSHLALRSVFRSSRLLSFAVCLFLPGMMFYGLVSLAQRRRHRFWRELQRRYAGLPTRAYVRDIGVQPAARGDGPDVVIILTGAALPGDLKWRTSVCLWPDGRGTVELRTLSPAYLGDVEVDQVEMSAGEAALSPAECDEARQLAAARFGGRQQTSIRTAVKDGSPAEVVVWVRGQGAVQAGDCNLAGIGDDQEDHPVVRLMQYVEQLARRTETAPPPTDRLCE